MAKITKYHVMSSDLTCPYMSGETDAHTVKKKYSKDSQEYETLQEITKLLENNPDWDMKDLKQYVHEKSIDVTSIPTKKLENVLRNHKKENKKKGFSLILENQKTKDGTIFLREYLDYNLNIKCSEKDFISVIWASPAQISRLRSSEHWYIDATFRICPDPFKQLIIIIALEPSTLSIHPCCYILSNSKMAISCEKILRSIKDFDTLHNSIQIKLNSRTLNFEKGLHIASGKVFPNIKMVGCLFHFKQALHRFACRNNLKTKKFKRRTNIVIKKIRRICWHKRPFKFLERMRSSLSKKPQVKIVEYVWKTWGRFIKNQMLDYNSIDQKYRANSVLESYNARLKTQIPFKPNWHKFLELIINKENYFNCEIVRKATNGELNTTKIGNNKGKESDYNIDLSFWIKKKT